MPLNKLAPHIAQLAGFGLIILTTPELDFSKSSFKPLPFESAAQLVAAFDEGAAKARAALKNTPMKPGPALEAEFRRQAHLRRIRFLAYRQMFLNHVVHHRAQLGVYLRMNEKPVPSPMALRRTTRWGSSGVQLTR